MAIAFIGTTNATGVNGQSTVTVSVTVNAGTDRVMVVTSAVGRSGGLQVDTISGIAFNTSENFTRACRVDDNVGQRTEIWRLVNPTVTTANVVVTYGGTANDNGELVSVLQFTGVDQVNPIDSVSEPNSNHGTTQNISLTTTATVADNCWIVESLVTRDDGIPVMGAQTNRTEKVNRIQNKITAGVSVLGPKTPAGTQVMDWTENAVAAAWEWCDCMAALNPTAVAASQVPYMPYAFQPTVAQ